MSNTQRTPQQAMADAIKSGAVQAWIDGKNIEQRWDDSETWMKGPGNALFTNPNVIWRPAPEPKLRPFTRDEVPPGCVIRLKANHSYWVMLTARLGDGIKCGVMTVAGLPTKFDRIHSHPEEYELSTDCGATWLPCGVMEESK